jgi:acetoacetate decarboxylase
VFGGYELNKRVGVNPPYSPAYPLEWEAELRTLEVVTRVDGAKVDSMLAETPFERVGDRVAFRFMLSPRHTLGVDSGEIHDLMVSVPVRYGDLVAHTHVFMYTSEPIGITAGREVFGYTKKDGDFVFAEQESGEISGSVSRRGHRLADYRFVPDPSAPSVQLVDSGPQAQGEIHVRRLPHPDGSGVVYADVVYRRTPLAYTAPVTGTVAMVLHACEWDPIADLDPTVLGAHFMTSDVFGGGFASEDRRLLEQLTPPPNN